jgi:hypothetical protein
MSNKHNVEPEAEASQGFIEFHIRPRITIGELVGLPNPNEGHDPIEALGIYKDKDDSTVVSYESKVFGPGGVDAAHFAIQIADHLERPATDQPPHPFA